MSASYLSLKPEFDILPMRMDDCAAVSLLHESRFRRPWSESEFESLFSQNSVFGFTARQINALMKKPLSGFVLARHTAGEAEILTIAVQAKLERSGLGWRLMQAAMREAQTRGGAELFLEVENGNAAALGLYRKLGFELVGERPAYYQAEQGPALTALVMKRVLR